MFAGQRAQGLQVGLRLLFSVKLHPANLLLVDDVRQLIATRRRARHIRALATYVCNNGRVKIHGDSLDGHLRLSGTADKAALIGSKT